MSNVPEPKTQREKIDQMWTAMIGLNGTGMVKRLERVEEGFNEHLRLTHEIPRKLDEVEAKVEEHQKWHMTNRLTIVLAGAGWLVAIVTTVILIV